MVFAAALLIRIPKNDAFAQWQLFPKKSDDDDVEKSASALKNRYDNNHTVV